MPAEEVFDVTVIGGGPAGLYSTFYSGLREMKTKLIEYQPTLGGKINVYPEKMIWDVGGLEATTGEQLMNQLIKQGLTFNPEVKLNEKITSITRDENGMFILHGASGGEKHYSKTVIIAIGSGILKPKKLTIDQADQFTNLNYTVKSLSHFVDRTVLVSGGGNSAIDWANELEPIAKKIYFTCRKDVLKGHEAQASQLQNSSIECFFNTSISDLISHTGKQAIDQVELTNHKTGEVSYVKVDEVIVNHGYEQDNSLLKNSPLGFSLKDDFFISGDSLSQSSVDGLYAAGDILAYNGKVNLIAGAFQDAANAVNQAKQFIQPDATSAGMVSSHNDVFKQRNKRLIKQLARK